MEIRLSDEHVTIVDDGSPFISNYIWYAHNAEAGVYARGRKIGSTELVYLHRLVIGAKPSQDVDHVNHLSLDNREVNLRACSELENGGNRRLNSNNKSGFKGVSFLANRPLNPWRARIKVAGMDIQLGLFSTAQEAADAYDEAAIKHFGEFAYTNAMMREERLVA